MKQHFTNFFFLQLINTLYQRIFMWQLLPRWRTATPSSDRETAVSQECSPLRVTSHPGPPPTEPWEQAAADAWQTGTGLSGLDAACRVCVLLFVPAASAFVWLLFWILLSASAACLPSLRQTGSYLRHQDRFYDCTPRNSYLLSH